nr:HIT family protein [Tepidicella baoligensis]
MCADDGGWVLWRQAELRIVRVTGAEATGFPGFYRVIWNAHVAEWTDLSEAEQGLLMRAVAGVERAVRKHLQPTKVNLASLGNMVPHLHWHVIARYDWDSHFPAPLWAAARRASHPERLDAIVSRLPACDAAIAGGVFRSRTAA